MRLRDYIEVSRLAQELIAEEGLSYIDAIEKAKEKLLSDRVGAHKSENSISKSINDSISLDEDIHKEI
ncbi:MAG: hypothetical protein E7D27_03570 [Clostridium celatum]|nr:hypothetical protein [Clostridium celatum]